MGSSHDADTGKATLLVSAAFCALPYADHTNGITDASISPTLLGGKGFGRFDVISSIGGTLPTGDPVKLGRSIAWSTTAQYHLGKYLWPESRDKRYLLVWRQERRKIAEFSYSRYYHQQIQAPLKKMSKAASELRLAPACRLRPLNFTPIIISWCLPQALFFSPHPKAIGRNQGRSSQGAHFTLSRSCLVTETCIVVAIEGISG